MRQAARGHRRAAERPGGAGHDGGAAHGVVEWSNGGDETDLAGPRVVEALDYWKSLLKGGSLSTSTVGRAQADVNDFEWAFGYDKRFGSSGWTTPPSGASRRTATLVPVPDRRPAGLTGASSGTPAAPSSRPSGCATRLV
ncbi:hypothetical protein GCM10020256_03130 [Streptomyces thermocoprophilus]